MGKTKNAFVVGTTGLNLPFGLIKNPIRDLWTVAVTSKYGFGPGAYMSGLVNSLASNFGFPTRLYNDYLRSHAAFGGFLNRAPEYRRKTCSLTNQTCSARWRHGTKTCLALWTRRSP